MKFDCESVGKIGSMALINRVRMKMIISGLIYFHTIFKIALC